MSNLKSWSVDVSKLTKSELKSKLWEELRIKADLQTQGVSISKEASEDGERLYTHLGSSNIKGGRNRDVNKKDWLPSRFFLPYGLQTGFIWNKNSLYRIELENGKHILNYNGNKLFEVRYPELTKYENTLSSDGTPLCLIGNASDYDKHVIFTYSNECSYKERDEDCLFCNINYDKELYTEAYAEKYGPHWRNPKQIAEAVKAAFHEGIADHLTITGGVIAERRELEYYVDAADAIKEALGVDEFNGTATVAAPLDLNNINKFKEAGFRTTALNLELWDKDFYRAVCPGKANGSGGWDHWVKALEYAVGVFGWGRVRSNFVAGIEPKSKTIEGFEYLGSKGVVFSFNIWAPNVGSAFEGHRSPETSWYVDLSEKAAAIWKKNGFTYDQIHDATAGDYRLPNDIYRIENEVFPIYEEAIQ
ncbi:MAG: radical SAM protein [Clostridium sp.]|uniref:radical SAM protein n=1 Tax=Clostridium sp. TaxID=1506 RepID=UPI0039E8DC5D